MTRSHLATRSLVFASALMGAAALACSDASTEPAASDPFEIAFAYAYNDTTTDIFVMPADGSTIKRIVFAPPGNAFPNWSPDGSTLLFTRADTVSSSLWVAAADGSGAHELTPGQDGFGGTWSPDGRSIAFVARSAAGSNLGVMNADGTGRRIVLSALNDVSGPPSWAPDGRIAFQRTRVGSQGVWSIRADGSGLARLTESDLDAGPRWSPDGSRLAFTSRGGFNSDGAQEYDLYVMKADGSGRQRLTGGGVDVRPAWSPDGQFIAYDHYTSASGGALRCLLFRVPAAGGAAVNMLPPRIGPQCQGVSWRKLPSASR